MTLHQYCCSKCGYERKGLLDSPAGIGGYATECPECGGHYTSYVVDDIVPNPNRHIRKNFHWVPDGIYDYSRYECRYLVKDGYHHVVITKLWLDNGGPDDVSQELRLPWGSYPDIPPKP
jgi:hypothetical protein